MKRKMVRFNYDDEKLLNHALQYDFSDYIKRLIEYDMVNNIFNDTRTIHEVYINWMSKNVWRD